MALRLICALPNPGCTGAPRGMFYPDTALGEKCAEEFARREDRPGWGVFNSIATFRDDVDLLETFQWVLEQNGISSAKS
jgi:hypothetical protein